MTVYPFPYFLSEREVPFMSKAASLKDGKDVSAFFQDIPVHRSLLEEK